MIGLIVAGRLVLRPLFRSVARTGSPELFVAACLLVILATGLATAEVGLPMELGSLIAGLLLAETEFRRQIEVTIEPFKGLLLGVFLISVGMSLDLADIAADAPRVVLGSVVLVVVKLAIIACLARAFGLRWLTGLQAGLLLGPGGEFGFVILGLARAEGLIGADVGALPAGACRRDDGLHPAAVDARPTDVARRAPLRQPSIRRCCCRMPTMPRRVSSSRASAASAKPSPRCWKGTTWPMSRSTADPDRVADQRKVRRSVYWGDITQPELLHRLHVESARALVVTMGDHAASDRLVAAARAARRDLLIMVRARDARHAAHLYAIGATDAVPETIEASLQLSEAVLVELGVPMGPVIAAIHEHRAELQAQIKAMAPRAEVRARGRRRLRDTLTRVG